MKQSTQSVAPIVLFAYKRPNEFAKTVRCLQQNELAPESELYIFVDGPKRPDDVRKVEETKAIAEAVTGFKQIKRMYAARNQGLANSVINGVTQVIRQHGSVIVLEDDLLTSRNFLSFMNQCLTAYAQQKQIFSVTGFSFPFDKPDGYTDDIYLFPRTGSWGWATWQDRWDTADWSVSDYDAFMQDKDRKAQFSSGGSDRVRMLRRWKQQQIDSWAIRWCYAQARVNGLTVYPTQSKIQNIGFSADSTHTNVYNRFRTTLDTGDQQVFRLPEHPVVSGYYLEQLKWQYSIPVRILNRLRTQAVRLKTAIGYG